MSVRFVWLIGWLAVRLFGWLAGCLFLLCGWLAGCLFGCLADGLGDCITDGVSFPRAESELFHCDISNWCTVSRHCVPQELPDWPVAEVAGGGRCPVLTFQQVAQGRTPGETVQYISAETEFFTYIRERIKEGESISMDQATRECELKSIQHNMQKITNFVHCKYLRKVLREEINQNVKQVKFTLPPQPNKPTLIPSEWAESDAVEDATERDKCDKNILIQKVFQSNMVICKSTEEAKKEIHGYWMDHWKTVVMVEFRENFTAWCHGWYKESTQLKQMGGQMLWIGQHRLSVNKSHKHTNEIDKCCMNPSQLS